MNIIRNKKLWTDVISVIVISLIPPFIMSPYEKHLSVNVINLLNHSSILGYIWICYAVRKIDAKHVISVAAMVWIIMAVAYMLRFWNQIGTEYTFRQIVAGGLVSETVSAIIGTFTYYVGSQLVIYYKHYCKGSA